VLVIEDNVDAADSPREVLLFGDHQVEVAYNGPRAGRAREFKPEVVLCDIGLPSMDGYEVARAFRADDALKGVFLVALSGYALPEDLQRAQEAGLTDTSPSHQHRKDRGGAGLREIPMNDRPPPYSSGEAPTRLSRVADGCALLTAAVGLLAVADGCWASTRSNGCYRASRR